MIQAGANEPSLRIAGIDPERGFAGGETQVLGLTLALMRAGHRAELLCDPAGVLWERARAAGAVCHPLRIRNSIDALAGFRLRKFLGCNSYDVVHFHTARAHALAPFARGRARMLLVTRRMDYVPNRLFAPWLFNRAVDGVVAISPAVAEALVKGGVERKRIAIIASGVDCERFRPPAASEREQARVALGLEPEEIAVGTLGALTPRKGHRFLIEAMAQACDRPLNRGAAPTPIRCLIAGDGALAGELEEQIRARQVDSSMRLIGPVGDPRALLWALDIFVMPSLQEGLGVAALEAMACGLPVIASAVGGLAQTVVSGVTGIQVAAGDAEALAQAIEHLA